MREKVLTNSVMGIYGVGIFLMFAIFSLGIPPLNKVWAVKNENPYGQSF